MRAERPRRDELATDEIIVAIDHLAVVKHELEKLRDLDVLVNDPEILDDDDRLRLARVKIQFLSDVVAAQNDVLESTAGTNISEIIGMVRDQCRYQYRGWVPTLGKNRVLSGIGGEGGQVTGGGGQVTGGGGQVTGGGGQVTGGGGALPSLPDRELPRASHRRRGEGVHVAVLDTPVYDPSAFPNVSYHDDTRPHSEPLPYEAGHAAFIVGLIAREASEAHVHVYPVLDAYATGSSWEIAKRMARLPEEVSIANLSFGCYTIDDKPPLVLQRAIEVLTPRVIVIAAAGNHRQPMRPRPFWPAAMDNVVAVGALDGDREADFSPRAPWVGAMAQGVDVISNYLNGEVDVAGTDVKFHGFAQWQGTSFAAATVSGQVAAHLAGRQSGWRAREVLAELMARADGDAGVRPSRFRPRHGG